MGKNRYENFIFSLMICFLMVTGMTLYNTSLQSSEGVALINSIISVKFIAILVVAFLIDWFMVAPVVKGVVKKVTTENTAFIKKVILISGLMVLMMCTVMSLLATLFHGYQGSFLSAYADTFLLNIIFALPLQFLLVGPVARITFFKLFPAPATVLAVN